MKVMGFVVMVGLWLGAVPAFAGKGLPDTHVDPNFIRSEAPCVLEAILKIRNRSLKPEISSPQIFLDNEITIREFADAVEPQWHFRPEGFVNVYVAHLNRIYLFADRKYYQKSRRSILDSLAHELHHFVQVAYNGLKVHEFSDFEESDAIEVQTAFREHYHAGIVAGISVCDLLK